MKLFNKKFALGLMAGAMFISQEASAATTHHRVIWDQDPTSTAVIGFSPDGTSGSPYVKYGSSTEESGWSTVNVDSSETFDGGLTSHFVRLTNLTPDSAVYYRVCDNSGCGQRFWFKTAPNDNSPYIVVAGGDTRTGWDTRRAGNTLISKIRPLFIMHGGDFTSGNSDSEMDQFLTDWTMTYSDDTIDGYAYKRIYPMVPTHGNHEDGNYKTLCEVFGVDYNQDGTCDESDTYGAFNVSPLLRVYTLNSQFQNSGWSSYATAMNNWLSSDLASNGGTATWRFAQYHKPMFPHYTGKSNNQTLFNWWADEFYDNAMNLVVESDTHICKLTTTVQPSGSTFAATTNGGTVYVGEGSWGAPARSANDAKSWTVDLASIQQFKVITVTSNELVVRTAEFDSGASTLSRADRESDPTVLPSNVNWWSADEVGTEMTLSQNAMGRSVIGSGSSNVAPTAGFTFATSDLTANFTDASTDSDGSIASRSWNFGDGGTSTSTNPSHTYASAGTYTVTLTVTDNDGATDDASHSVTVSDSEPTNDAPTAAFSFDTTDLTATFTDGSTDSDGSIVAYSWNFGDGGTSTSANPSHTYASAGTYSVTLTVTDDDDATNSTSHSVTVTAPSGGGETTTVEVRVSQSSDDAEEAVDDNSMYMDSSDLELIDDSGEQVVGIRFQNVNIPQGATITSAYLQFATDETGSTTTNLTIKAQDSDNAATFSSTDGDISGRATTTASVSWSPAAWNTVGALNDTPNLAAVVQEVVNRSGWTANNGMAFIITGSGERTAESYDGSSATAPLLHVEYEGESGGGDIVAPTAGFSFDTSDLTATFTDSSTDSDGTIASYSWNFGDGGSSTAQNPSHTYASAGTYTVTLTVTDNDSATDSTSQSVTVTAPAGGGDVVMSVNAYKSGWWYKYADLTWSGAQTTNVDVYANGSKLETTSNDGTETYQAGWRDSSITYKVCEEGSTTACSDPVTASW